MNDLTAVFSALCLVVRQAGIIALAFQGKVANEGKEFEMVSADETELMKARRTAKTLIDEVVQEIILTGVLANQGKLRFLLDAEEKTPSVVLFDEQNTHGLSLIIDPVDGTLEYLEGKDSFSINVGIVENGRIKLAIVFFPVRELAYVVAPDGKSYICPKFGTQGMAEAWEMRLPAEVPQVVYKNSRVPESIVTGLEKAKFTVIDDAELGCPDAILAIFEGQACAYVSANRQIRDILLGAIVGNAQNGYVSDWEGQNLHWPESKRVPHATFGHVGHRDEINQLIARSS